MESPVDTDYGYDRLETALKELELNYKNLTERMKILEIEVNDHKKVIDKLILNNTE